MIEDPKRDEIDEFGWGLSPIFTHSKLTHAVIKWLLLVFFFKTFGFPVNAQVVEYALPKDHQPVRIAWHGWAGEPDSSDRLDVHHAWLIEDLPHNRVRILTQETQIGRPAQELAQTKPNPMLNGHQDWLDGLVKIAKAKI